MRSVPVFLHYFCSYHRLLDIAGLAALGLFILIGVIVAKNRGWLLGFTVIILGLIMIAYYGDFAAQSIGADSWMSWWRKVHFSVDR